MLGKAFNWFFLALMLVTPPLMMGSLVGLAGSALYAGIPALGFTIWCTIAFLGLIPGITALILLILVRVLKIFN